MWPVTKQDGLSLCQHVGPQSRKEPAGYEGWRHGDVAIKLGAKRSTVVWVRKFCGMFRPALAEIDEEIFEI